jgi:two-component system, chemotaxis family, sensor kinase CheA
MNPDLLLKSLERELRARLEAASRATQDTVARLELHRARVATRAAQHPREGFLRSLETAWWNPEALRDMTANDDTERAWLELAQGFARQKILSQTFEAERAARASNLQTNLDAEQRALEGYRLDVAHRAFGLHSSNATVNPTPREARLEPASPPVSRVPAAPLEPSPPSAPPEESVRVGVTKLDALLSLSGELRVAQIRLSDGERELRGLLRRLQSERRRWRTGRHDAATRDNAALLERVEDRSRNFASELALLDRRLAQDNAALRALVEELEDEVLGARLLPAALLLPPLERLVRDLSQRLEKRARLVTVGADVEMDRRIVEGLRDPLMHMIRNALDHGLETPQERVRRGKPDLGTITLEFSTTGGTVTLELRDDGAGINPEMVLRRALERELITDAASVENPLELIFAPGFSTAVTVTETSGRGVGMDVVRENIRQLGGTVNITSQVGQGTRFTLRVPAQLATTRVLLMRVGTQTLAVGTSGVERTGRTRATDITSVGGKQTVQLEGRAVELVELGGLLEVEFDSLETWQPFVVLRDGEQRLACAVDALLNEQEIIVKRLGFPLSGGDHLIGAAVLGSGQLVPILSVQALLQRAARTRTQPARRDAARVAIAPVRRYKVLVVDDSLTTRTLERSILEASGFETRTAVDGAQALESLRAEPVDLVLSDVEMPRLDGFGLTSAIRADPKLARIPVILVTSLDAPEHKERGAAAGADAYIVKSEFDQARLLETIGRLL